MKKPTIQITRDSKLEREVEQHLQNIEKITIRDIGLAAIRPDVPLESVLNEMNAGIDEITAFVTQYCQPRASQLKAAVDKIKLDQLEKDTAMEMAPIKRELRAASIDVERNEPEYPLDRKTLVMLAILFPCLLDALLNIGVFQAMDASLLVSAVLTVTIAGSLAAGAHALGKKMQETPDSQTRWGWLMGGMAGASAVFLLLGLVRQEFYGQGSGWVSHPLWWILFNLFFFSVATFISFRFLPTKRQEAEIKTYKALLKKLKKLEQKKSGLQRNLIEAREKHANLIANLGSWIAYEKDLIKRIEKRREKIQRMAIKEYHLKGGGFSKGTVVDI